jgi:hypothetical protein
MHCDACNEDISDEFTYCPYCGRTVSAVPPDVELPPSASTSTLPELQTPVETPRMTIYIGTWVFGAFAAISLFVSILKGLVPIFLLEAAAWAFAAWYWQRKNPKSESAKTAVVILGVLAAIGEVVHITSQSSSPSTPFSVDIAAPVSPGASPYESNISPTPTAPLIDGKAIHSTPTDSANDKPSRNAGLRPSMPTPNAETIWRKASYLFFDKEEYRQAAPLLDQSCNNGYAYACEILGWMYDVGDGVPGDSSRAAALYARMATLYLDECNKGSRDGCSNVWNMYHAGYNDTLIREKYLPRKVTLFTGACDSGNAAGCFYLGGLYRNGEDVVQDDVFANAEFRKSCALNDADGCVSLGLSYQHGEGVPKDADKAKELYSKGCSLGAQTGCDSYKELHPVRTNP